MLVTDWSHICISCAIKAWSEELTNGNWSYRTLFGYWNKSFFSCSRRYRKFKVNHNRVWRDVGSSINSLYNKHSQFTIKCNSSWTIHILSRPSLQDLTISPYVLLSEQTAKFYKQFMILIPQNNLYLWFN